MSQHKEELRVAVISDTHDQQFHVPPCDVIVHAGDLTNNGTNEELYLWLGYLQGTAAKVGATHVLLVPGNHDYGLQDRPLEILDMIAQYDSPVQVLCDRAVTIEGRTFWGSPWTLPFHNWAFMAGESELEEAYLGMPGKLDMLITHGPPFGILDSDEYGVHRGSQALRDAVRTRDIRTHVFGHMHEDGGKSVFLKPTAFCNVAATRVDHVNGVYVPRSQQARLITL